MKRSAIGFRGSCRVCGNLRRTLWRACVSIMVNGSISTDVCCLLTLSTDGRRGTGLRRRAVCRCPSPLSLSPLRSPRSMCDSFLESQRERVLCARRIQCAVRDDGLRGHEVMARRWRRLCTHTRTPCAAALSDAHGVVVVFSLEGSRSTPRRAHLVS